MARAEPAVRWPLILIAALSLVGLGPFLVGGAALAETRLGGASALALLFSGYGLGTLIGLGAVARLGITDRRRPLVLSTVTVMGLGLAALGLVEAPAPALAAAAAVGVAESVLDVALTTWLQESAPEEVMARVMSLVVLAYVGTDPLSYAVAGLLLPLGVTALFLITGGFTVLAGLLALRSPSQRAASYCFHLTLQPTGSVSARSGSRPSPTASSASRSQAASWLSSRWSASGAPA